MFYNSTVRRSMPELDIITNQIRKMEGLLYVAFTISVKEVRTTKLTAKGKVTIPVKINVIIMLNTEILT